MKFTLTARMQRFFIRIGNFFLKYKFFIRLISQPVFLNRRNRAYLSEEARQNQFSYYIAGRATAADLESRIDGALAAELRAAKLACAYMDDWDPVCETACFNTFFLGLNAKKVSAENVNLIYPQTYKTFHLQNASFAFIYINLEDPARTHEELIAYCRETAAMLKKQGCAFVSVFVKYPAADGSRQERIRDTLQKLSACADELVGLAGPGQPVCLLSPLLQNVGDLIPSGETNGSVLLYRSLRIYRKTAYNLARAYVPLFWNKDAQSLKKIELHAPAEIETRREISTHIDGVPEVFREISLSRLLEIIGTELPAAYAGFADMPVDDFVTYPFYIRKKNTVMFFREYNPLLHELSEPAYYNFYTGMLCRKISAYKRIFVISPVPLPETIPHVVVGSVPDCHADLCRAILDLYDLDYKIAITGSIGKTSCKEMAYTVLGKKYKVMKSPDNENLQVKMHSVFHQMDPSYQIYIQEVGGGMIGRASSFSKVIRPDIAVVTNVGTAHLRFSKTREQLAINKIGVGDGLRKNGPLLVNFDNDKLLEADYTGRNIITYAIDNPAAEYRAENIVENDTEITFEIVHGAERYPARLTLPGKHNVYNALTSFIIGRFAQVPTADIIDALAEFQPEGIRQHIDFVGGYRLYIDCFNASYESMVSAVRTLAKINTEGKKIAVLADMTGLDEDTEKYHRELGEKISAFDIDALICYGKDIKETFDHFRNENVKKYYCETAGQARDRLRALMRPGDCILFKGSSKYKLETDLIDGVFGTNYTRLSYNHRRVRKETKDGVLYRYYLEYVAVGKNKTADAAHARLKSRLGARDVTSVEEAAFAFSAALERVTFPKKLRNIQQGAFRECASLREISLPDTLRIVGAESFMDCTALERVRFGREIIHIGENAFAGCTNLKTVSLPAGDVYIAPNAFEGCGADLKIERY